MILNRFDISPSAVQKEKNTEVKSFKRETSMQKHPSTKKKYKSSAK
jgi:hypothetical protein